MEASHEEEEVKEEDDNDDADGAEENACYRHGD